MKLLLKNFYPNSRFVFLWIGALLLAASFGVTQAKETAIVDASQMDQAAISLIEYLAVLEDPGLALTLADVKSEEFAARFQTGLPPATALNYGYSHSAYWLRLRLRNNLATPIERLIEIASPTLDQLDFYLPDSNNLLPSISTGVKVPVKDRSNVNRQHIFPLTLAANSEQVVYVRIQSINPTNIPAALWTPHGFAHYARNDYAVQAVYFGMVLAMILFNMVLWIALNDRLYLLYIISVTCSALSIASGQGFAKEFLWPDATDWASIATTVFYSLNAVSLIFLMRSTMNTRKIIPRFDPYVRGFALALLLTPIGYVLNYPVFIKVAAVSMMAAILLIVGISVYCAYKKQRSAIFFVAAYAVLLLGGVIIVMRNSGLIPINGVTLYAFQFGSALEMLILSFALADRYHLMRKERAQAQAAALQAEQDLVGSLRHSERVLEDRVTQRTLALSVSNNELQAAQQHQRQMVAMLSHEFRNPLAAISRSAQLSMYKLADTERQRLESIRNKADGLYALVDRLLTNESLDYKAAMLMRQKTPLSPLLQEVICDLEAQTRVRLSVEPDSANFLLDHQLFALAVSNLLNNALRYSPAESHVTLYAHIDAAWLRLTISDHGFGMSTQEIAQLGTPYFRAPGSKLIGGTGLGFLIARKIIHAHEGQLSVSSTPSVGTTMEIILPTVDDKG